MKLRTAKKILKGIINESVFKYTVYNSDTNKHELIDDCYLSNKYDNYNFKRYNKHNIDNAIRRVLKEWHNKHKTKKTNTLKEIEL